MKKTADSLKERVKELECLYGLSDVTERSEDSPEKMLKEAVKLLPRAYTRPDKVCAKIDFSGREFKTRNFKPTRWKSSAPTVVRGRKEGHVEVCYLEVKPRDREGLFPAEERALLKAFSGRLGRVIERRTADRDLKNVYREVVETQSQLVQAAKMTAVGQLAGGVAHEIKNALATIIHSVNYLEKNAKLEEGEARKLGLIKKTVFEADKIVYGLLDFARPSPLKLKSCDLNRVIDGSLELAKSRISLENVKISKEYAIRPPYVMADKNQMQQVFVNIILNSLQAMPKGGTLAVRTCVRGMTKWENNSAKTILRLSRPADTVFVCEIEDSGEGISDDKLSRVFDPFFTTKKLGEGVGLGLSVTSTIVEKHRGIVNIESSKGHGTKVTVAMPTVCKTR